MEEKKYKLKICPKCNNKHIRLSIGEKCLWECNCGWKGHNPIIKNVSFKEYLKFAESILE